MTYSLLAPGPVNVHPDVLRVMSEPMIHHRTPQFDEIFKRVRTNLKTVFQTQEDVFIHGSTGSGGMESLLVNTLSPGDEILCVVSGKFGERWAEMVTAFGGKAHIYSVSWGESVVPGKVEDILKTNPKIRAVLCQACETSTGVLHPIQELGKLIHKYPQVLLLVDGITALGAFPLPMDEWKIDGLVGGSQKAFMLPTGLSFVSFSQKAWARIPSAKMTRYYFDVQREKKANQNGESFFSSPVILIRGLDVVLQMIMAEGLEKHFQTIERRALFTRKFAPQLGLSIYPQIPSCSLTALKVKPDQDSQKIRSHLEKQYQITIMGGQDQLKGKIIRIGHMGYIPPEQMVDLMLSLEKTMGDLGYKTAQAFDKNILQNYWLGDGERKN